MWFYKKELRITWTENVSNREVLRIMETRSMLILRIRKRVKISGTHIEERGLREFDTHRDTLNTRGADGNSE